MRTLLLAFLLSLLALPGFTQKIAFKNNLVTVDGRPYLHLEADGTGLLYASSPRGERLFVVKALEFYDPARIAPNNPLGSVDYLQFVFTASRLAVETTRPATFSKLPVVLGRIVYVARLLRPDGSLDLAALQDFSVNNGTPYTDRQRLLSQAPPLWVPVPGQ